ncbi:MAG: Uma2 family endonuclease [Planctomycetota bacterium]
MSPVEAPQTPRAVEEAEAPLRGVTADQLLRDFIDQRCELIQGEVILMSPASSQHGMVAFDFGVLLGQYVKQNQLGRCFAAETGFLVQRDPDTVLAPACSVVLAARIKELGVPTHFFPEAPAVAVEVVSPSDSAEAVDDNARRWLAAGTRLVWVLYPTGRRVTVDRSLEEARLLAVGDTLDGADVLPGFAVKVSELFAGLDDA